jgi:hypothetical protein
MSKESNVLTLFGKPHSGSGFCDGVNRRDFLTIGGSVVGGLTLADLLRAESGTGIKHTHKAVINIYLPGGPPHIDMFDLKPEAPAEIRGEFKPIKTNVPGIEICELFPKMAAMMDKFVIIRSMADCHGDHDAYQCMTGRKSTPQTREYWPGMGSWVAKVQGNASQSVPPNLSLMYRTGEQRWGYPGVGGFLGSAYNPFRLVESPSRPDRPNRRSDSGSSADNMRLRGITLDRLQDRVQLLKSFDNINRSIDQTGQFAGSDGFNQQALGILTTSKLRDALDLSKEDPKVVEKYGVDDPAFERDGAPRMVRNFCIARRLVEAGARVVTMNFTRWDWHGGDGMNFVQARKDFPLLDKALTSLITDLHERGLDKDVSVVVWGEFGRTPRLNKSNSRDHWPQASFALLAGGGMKTGQVIGATNKYAEHPVARPVKFQEVFATLYTSLGINLGQTRIFDLNGRPQYLVEPDIGPMRELI